MKRLVSVLVLSAFVIALALAVGQPSASANPRYKVAPKVFVLALFTGEQSNWLAQWPGIRQVKIDVPEAFAPVYCTGEWDPDLCITVTGMGNVNSAATVMAVGMSDQFDFRRTYFMVAGIAGTQPDIGTLGSVAWAEWIVDGDLAHEIDRSELPDSWDYPYFRLGCAEPWCDDAWVAGTEVFHLNPRLADAAYEISKDVSLYDTDQARAYRSRYPQPAAQASPQVLRCDTVSAMTYWHGQTLSNWATWWTQQLTNGAGRYCMTAMESAGIAAAMERLSKSRRVDLSRLMVARSASNFDQQPPGMTALESVSANSGGFLPSIINVYRVGGAVAHHIVDNWKDWKDGVPEAN